MLAVVLLGVLAVSCSKERKLLDADTLDCRTGGCHKT